MYTYNGPIRGVGERRPHYAGGGMEPERFPAEMVLRDLSGPAGEQGASLILARYAALRAWWLAASFSDERLRTHGVTAARGYIAATPEGWPERPLLDRLLDVAADEPAAELLVAIAVTAESIGHMDGAFAARRAAWTAEVRALRLDAAAELAAGTAGFLRRCGESSAARDWDDAAKRLRRASSSWGQPSMS